MSHQSLLQTGSKKENMTETKDKKPVRVARRKIDVDQETIRTACRRNDHHCMISEAVRQQIKGATKITSDFDTIRWSIPDQGLRYSYRTPQNARQALALFDAGETPAPFKMVLKNGQVYSIAHRKADGEGRTKLVHKFGKEKFQVSNEGKNSLNLTTQIIGGAAPPVRRPKHGSHSSIRKFGLRSFTKGWIWNPEGEIQPEGTSPERKDSSEPST
jgi:hypothetical protein